MLPEVPIYPHTHPSASFLSQLPRVSSAVQGVGTSGKGEVKLRSWPRAGTRLPADGHLVQMETATMRQLSEAFFIEDRGRGGYIMDRCRFGTRRPPENSTDDGARHTLGASIRGYSPFSTRKTWMKPKPKSGHRSPLVVWTRQGIELYISAMGPQARLFAIFVLASAGRAGILISTRSLGACQLNARCMKIPPLPRTKVALTATPKTFRD